jgi:3-phenylpropionate/trans-cinnamate dioxygenase ferredoxin subunit
MNTLPPAAVLQEEGARFAVDDTWINQDASLRNGSVDAPPAKLPVRHHEVTVIRSNMMTTELTDVPSLPPGLTADRTSKHQPMHPNQRTCSWL